MRERYVSDLIKELLGPRSGSEELLPIAEDPRNEYLLGQLFPPDTIHSRAPEEEQGLAAEGISAEGDEDGEEVFGSTIQSQIESGQNFRRVPSSMGLSFLCNTLPGPGEIDICITWGRYKKNEDLGWQRIPKFLSKSFGGNLDDSYLGDSVRATYKATEMDGQVKISIYASSEVTTTVKDRVSTEDIIFQPEIRVVLSSSLQMKELGESSFATSDDEWRLATRQYDKLKVFARGHLCGVYWKEIDPQRPFELVHVAINGPPFEWTDGKKLISKHPELDKFFLPNLRTDFSPLYYIPSPKVDASIELRADKIAEFGTFTELAAYLSPLIDKYHEWIIELEPDQHHKKIDTKIIELHREALSRIKIGVATLQENVEAFNSFIFMNKAMSMQYAWGRKPEDAVMKWRPFQLAFILLSLNSTIDPNALDRNICDTIWFPTGGGKTEAYLGLAAFALAYRRRSSDELEDGSKGGEGTCVISRYTLRLLTIQQFRRALKMIMACEILRCSNLKGENQGWVSSSMKDAKGFVWGKTPFSIGLWVGYSVTPSKMTGKAFYGKSSAGATELLLQDESTDTADPAQVIDCPCCSAILALPNEGLTKGDVTLHLPVSIKPTISSDIVEKISSSKITVNSVTYHSNGGMTGTLTINISLKENIRRSDLSRWWRDFGRSNFNTELCSFSAARPGYIKTENSKGRLDGYEIRCPNPACDLNKESFRSMELSSLDEWSVKEVHPWYASPGDSCKSNGIPIGAITVDEELYECPTSMVVGTCDKIASVAFKKEASSLFGRVRSYTPGAGYSQEVASGRKRIPVTFLQPPSLIIQDELHLLEGPLGSSFGLYETTVDYICERPKYIASSATIRNSSEQIRSIMSRDSRVFPPVSLDNKNGFFLKSDEAHQLDESSSGRLFLGLGFPGRAPQTPMVRIWGRLLQTGSDLQFEGTNLKELDPYWTLIGYFNAVRELAQGEALLRQDIPQFLDKIKLKNPACPKRDVPEGTRNLSSQTPSNDLPAILSAMERTLHNNGDPLNTVSSTSMFGTGVDVSRLSLMVVHGQPKSASQYIQAVGRIGRSKSGLAIVFFRVSKPRDLNHYEYFTGYHRRLPVSVEPITVMPLAPKALDRLTGGLLAMLVRHWRNDTMPMPLGIDDNDGALLAENIEKKVQLELISIFQKKYDNQPEFRRPHEVDEFLGYVQSKLEKWLDYSRQHRQEGKELPYASGLIRLLGEDLNSISVFPNTPRSLREVEPTINIHIGGR
jgi:hypothetical protein